MYTPNSAIVYTAAFSGALAGMGVSGRQPTDDASADYDFFSNIAGLFAQELDTLFASSGANALDAFLIECACFGYWQDRQPNATQSFSAAQFTEAAEAILATLNSAIDYFADQGITPPNFGGSGLPAATQAGEIPVYNGSAYVADGPVLYNIFFYGHSYVEGLNASNPDVNSFGPLVITSLGPVWSGARIGRGGFSTNQLLNFVDSDVDDYYVPGAVNVFLYLGQLNDTGQGISAAQQMRQQEMMCQGRKNAGWRVIATTAPQLAAFSGPENTTIVEVNAFTVANYTRFADYLADFGANALIGNENTSPTYFAGGHWNTAGHAVAATVVEAILPNATTITPQEPVSLPFDLSGPILAWYGASNALRQSVTGNVGDPVAVDKDCSRRGCNAVQATTAAQPLLAQEAGSNVLEFDGTDDELAATFVSYVDTPQTGTYSVARVIKLATSQAVGGISAFSPGQYELVAFSGNVKSLAGSTLTDPTSIFDGANHLIIATYFIDVTGFKTIQSLYVDGAPIAVGAATPNAPQEVTADLYVASTGGANFGNIIDCEHILMQGQFSEEDILSKLQPYLITKWSLASVAGTSVVQNNSIKTAGAAAGVPVVWSEANLGFSAVDVTGNAPYAFTSPDNSAESWKFDRATWTASERKTLRTVAANDAFNPLGAYVDDIIETSVTGLTLLLPPTPKNGDKYTGFCSAVGAALVTFDGNGNDIILAGASGATQVSGNALPLTAIFSTASNVWLAATSW